VVKLQVKSMTVSKILLLILALLFLHSCDKNNLFKNENDDENRTASDLISSLDNPYGNWIVMYYKDLESG